MERGEGGCEKKGIMVKCESVGGSYFTKKSKKRSGLAYPGMVICLDKMLKK